MKHLTIYSLLLSITITLTSCLSGVHYALPVKERRVYTGLENFITWHSRKYRGKKCLLITNHSGVDRNLNRNVDLLRGRGIDVYMIMAPEHGLYGYQNEYDENMYLPDEHNGAIIYNLHKLDHKSFRYLAAPADIIIFDIQDMGMRCYTYISNLKFVMDAMKGSKKEIIVLDRPNPLGFLDDDGAFLEDGFRTRFVSAFPAPLIYDMTMGEAARYYRGEYRKNVKLKVIPLLGYDRHMYYHDTSMPWVPPSPNLPSYRSSIAYSAVVLMECINISLGRGTTMPFEYIGAPWIDPVKFCHGLKKLGIEAFTFRPVYFKPLMRKYEGEVCGGAHLIYTGKKFKPTEISYKITQYILSTYPEAQWDMYKDKFEIDAMAGTDKFRKAIMVGLSFGEYEKIIEPAVKQYRKKRRKYLLY